MFLAFSYGLFFGIGLTLPMGPQNLFVLNQGLHCRNKRQIIAVVIAAGLCDSCLITAAVLGLTLLLLQWSWVKELILILGILMLSYLGWKAWISPPIEDKAANTITSHQKLTHVIFLTLLISLMNPYALLDTMVTIGSISLTYTGFDRSAFTIGCIIASWLWFISLAVLGKKLYQFIWIRKNEGTISAMIIWLAASYLLYQLVLLF